MELTRLILNNDSDIQFKCRYLVSKIKELNCSVFLDDQYIMHFIYALDIENYVHLASPQFEPIAKPHLYVKSAQAKAVELKEKDEAFLKMMEVFLNKTLKAQERLLFYEVYFLNHSIKDISLSHYHCESKIRKDVKQLNKTLTMYLTKNS